MLNNIFQQKIGEDYKKNDQGIYQILDKYGNQAFAKKNADKLLKYHEGKTPEFSKPSTTVHQLVEQLQRFVQ